MPGNKRYCCVCKNCSGKVVDGKRVSMHRFPADTRLRKIWIQRCKNARPNFVFVNSDQTRLCSVHFLGRSGPSKENPLPCMFPRPDGSEKVYKLSQVDEPAMTIAAADTDSPVNVDTAAKDSPDASFESESAGIFMCLNDSVTDMSLKFHDYGSCVITPSRIRHQSEQTNIEVNSVETQTDVSEIPAKTRTYGTQTSVEICDVGVQVNGLALTFEDISNNDSKVLFYTGIPDAGTFRCLFDELEPGIKGKNTGRPKSLRLIDEFCLVLMRLRLGLLI